MGIRIPQRVDSPPILVWSPEDDAIDLEATPDDVWAAYMSAEDISTDRLVTNDGTPAVFSIRPLSPEELEVMGDIQRDDEVGIARQLTECARLGVVGVDDCDEWAPEFERSGGTRRLTKRSIYALPTNTRQWLGWVTWNISQLTEKKS